MNIKILPAVNMSSHYVVELIRHLGLMHAVVPLTSFKVEYIAEDEKYLYKFIAQDGRKWTQHLSIPEDATNPVDEYGGDFDTDVWFKPEFITQRPIRDSVIGMIATFNITEITITF